MLFLLFAGVSESAAQRTKLVLKRIRTFYSTAQTIQADVTAETYYPTLKITDSINGKLKYIPKSAKTKRMYVRLDWLSPDERLSVIGDRYVLYRPYSRIAYVGSVSDAGKKFAKVNLMQLLDSEAEFKRKFRIKFKGLQRLRDRTAVWRLRLIPRFAADFRFVNLLVDGNGMIRTIVITKKDGGTITYFLSNVIVNAVINGKDFINRMPKDVKIIK